MELQGTTPHVKIQWTFFQLWVCKLVLEAPEEQPLWAYALLQKTTIPASVLTPLLRNLENKGILTSTLASELKQPRRYYRLTQTGKELVSRMLLTLSEKEAA